MKNEKRNYLVVGTFVIAMAVALIVWISLMAGQMGASDRYSVVFGHLNNVKPGARVLFEGFPVGLVDTITPMDRDGRRVFSVGMAVEEGWPIPANSTASITQGLFSAPELSIERGDSAQMLAPGSEIQPLEGADILDALKTTSSKANRILDEVAEAAPGLVGDAEALLAQLETSAGRINEILNPENVRRISSILGNFEEATNEANHLLVELRKASENVDLLVGHLDALLDEESGDVSQAIDDARHTLATIARHIDAITADLEDTTRNLNEFSKQLRANPGVLIRGRASSDDGGWSQ